MSRILVLAVAITLAAHSLAASDSAPAYVDVRPAEAVFAGGQRAIRVLVRDVQTPAPMVVRTGDRVLWSGTLAAGNSNLLVPGGLNETIDIPVRVDIAGTVAFEDRLALTPVPTRELHLLADFHFGIGGSAPHSEVEQKQGQNLRKAVELGITTADFPEAARFRVNVVGASAVERYLDQAGAEERRAFADAVGFGTISLTATETNMLTGLATPEELRAWTMAARRVQAQYGFAPVRSAVLTTTSGLSWPVVGALAESGVRYLSVGPGGGFGLPSRGNGDDHAWQALGDKPFWWVSQSGEERLLVWMAARGCASLNRRSTPIKTGGQLGRDDILGYAGDLTAGGYPYDLAQVRCPIDVGDGPSDLDLSAFVRDWNARFETPRLVINTADALFAEFEHRYGRNLPEQAGDLTPYGEENALSTPADVATIRSAVRRLAQADALSAMSGVLLSTDSRAKAWIEILRWHERARGAFDGKDPPGRPDIPAHLKDQRLSAERADTSARAILDAATPRLGWTGTGIDVVNTLSWQRSGLLLLPAAWSTAGDRVLAGNDVLPSQRLKDGSLAVWVDHLLPFRSIRLRVRPGQPGLPRQPVRVDGTTIDNSRLRLTLNEAAGAVSSLRWAGADGHDFVAGAPGLFRYVYVPGGDPAQAVGGTGGRLTIEDAGPIVATVRIDDAVPGTSASSLRIRMVASTDVVSVQLEVNKTRSRSKESAHMAFPLDIPGGVTRVDQGEALVEIGRDQLPGSCREFIGAHSTVDVSGPRLGFSIVSQDAPLIELGALTDERLTDAGSRSWRGSVVPGTTLYAYLLRNDWGASDRTGHEGPMTFRFSVRPHGAFDPVELWRLGAEQDYPLIAYISDSSVAPMRPPFTIQGASVVVSSLRQEGGGLVARLYNPSTSQAVIRLLPGPLTSRILSQDRSGQFTTPAVEPLTVPAHGTRVILIER